MNFKKRQDEKNKCNVNPTSKKKKIKEALDESSEFLIIALLLNGDLELDNITVDRDGTVTVCLEGHLKKDKKEDNAQKIASFLEENGSLTINDVLDGLRLRLNKE